MNSTLDLSDIAVRTRTFRTSLIEEFRLSESDTTSAFEAAKYSSDAFRNPGVVDDVLRHKPHTLIKFKIFKRQVGEGAEEDEEEKRKLEEQRKTRKQSRLQKNKASLSLKDWAIWLQNSKWFDSFIIFSILLNAVIIGIQTSIDEVEDWTATQAFKIIDITITVTFVLEILVKWTANFWDFWKDGWNRFDFFITAASLVPLIIDILSQSAGRTSQGDNFSGIAKTLRVFRTFRTLKMITKSRSLRIIVRTIMVAISSLSFVMLLLSILMYVFSILAITIFEQYTKSPTPGLVYQDMFEDILTAFLSLFQLITLDQWFNIAEEIRAEGSVSTEITIFYFVIWVFVGAFIFRNIIIGVMVKNFQSISQELSQLDQASRKRARMQKNVKELHNQLVEKKRQTIFLADEEKKKKAEKNTVNQALPVQTTIEPGTKKRRGSMSEVESPGENNGKSLTERSRRMSAPDANQIGGKRPKEMGEAERIAKGDEWQKFVLQSIQVFQEQDSGTTLWPRDTLLEYLQTMERLQENIKEYQELQHLAALALYNIVTDS